jgi:TetR/AcrR family transcriptional repressor of multidrug resistance operon
MDKKTDKKQAIFESTLELINEHGFHGAPMSLVAKNAGVAAGTIYHYFDSKEQLICALYDYNRARLLSVIEAALDKNQSYKNNFFSIWTNLYRFYVEEPNVLTFFEQFVNSPYNVNKYPNHFRGKLYDFLAQGIRDGFLKPVKPEMLLVLVMSSITASAKLHIFNKLSLTKNDLQHIAEMMWEGIASIRNINKSK